MKKISGGALITKILIQNGISKAFCVPGESYLGVLEAIRESKNKFDLVVCRHEGGAAYMAEAYGRLTQMPGICFVTRGPGACNASIGVHTAYHEGTPLILFVGQVPVKSLKKNAFQSIDTDKFFNSMAKYTETIKDPKNIRKILEKAIYISTEGKPGPVVLAIPEDIQFAMVSDKISEVLENKTHKIKSKIFRAYIKELNHSNRPIIVLSGSKWKKETKKKLETFAKNNDIPFAVTFRKNDLFDNQNKKFVGSLGVGPDTNLVSFINESDHILLIGGELGEIETNKFSRLVKSKKDQKIFHITDNKSLINKSSYDLLVSDINYFCELLCETKFLKNGLWGSNSKSLRESYENYIKPKIFKNKINPGLAVKDISDNSSANTIITAGAGNYTHFILRHHKFRQLNTLLAPINAPMGYSVPASITAALLNKNKEIICYAGDGCFMMNFQEMVIAFKRNLKITFIIFNNGIYGSIRMHQEFKYPGKTIATSLNNPEFVSLSKSFGIKAINIKDPQHLFKNYTKLRNNFDGPILLNMNTDPEIINPQKTIDELTN